MKILIRPVVDPQREIDLAHRPVASAADDNESSAVISDSLVGIKDYIIDDPRMIGSELPTTTVVRPMFQNRFHRVIVAGDENSTLGVITSTDLPGAFPQAQ